MKKTVFTILMVVMIPCIVFASGKGVVYRGVSTGGAVAAVGIEKDTTTTHKATTVNTTTSWSHTCTGADRFLFVVVGVATAPVGRVTGVTYNSVSLTKAWDASQSGVRQTSGWYLVNPTTSSNTIEITVSESTSALVAIATSYTGVNQSEPAGSGATATGYSSAPSVDVSAASTNELIIDGVATASSLPTVHESQTDLGGDIQGALYVRSSSEDGIDGSVTMS